MNINCIICSDLISQTENIYFTKCGHVFHYHCLVQWIERSKSCPQCRNKVTEKCISRVYFNFASGEGIVEDATTLQSKLDNANFQLLQRDTDIRLKGDKIQSLENKLKVNEEILKGTEKKLVSKESAILSLKDQLEYIKVQNRETERLRSENERLEKSLNTLNGLQKVLNATVDEVDRMLADYPDVKTIATFAIALKRALYEAEAQKNNSRSKLHALKTELSSENSRVTKLEVLVRQLQEKLSAAERKTKSLLSKRKMDEASRSPTDTADETPTKIHKSYSSTDVHGKTPAIDSPSTSKADDSLNDLSMRSLVKRIEDSDSPYLKLQQGGGGVGLSMLRVRNTLNADNIKPSEFPIVNPSKSVFSLGLSRAASTSSLKSASQDNPHSIFNKPHNKSVDMFMDDMETVSESLETSYDGLGGHSKPDVFPVPLKKSPLKGCIPKVTARHRLKNPNSTKTTSIGKYFNLRQDR